MAILQSMKATIDAAAELLFRKPYVAVLPAITKVDNTLLLSVPRSNNPLHPIAPAE
jgi:hypothetical protein